MYYEKTALNGDTVLGVFYAAKKYMIPTLETVCKDFLDNELDPSNVMPVLEQVCRKNYMDYLVITLHVFGHITLDINDSWATRIHIIYS